MNFKLFAICLVAFCTIHVSTQNPLKDDSIKTILVEVLERILSKSGEILQKGNNLVDSAEKNQDQITAEIIAKAIDEGKLLNNALLNLLDGLRDEATSDGIAVLDCIRAEQDKTEKAFEEISTTVGNCAASEITVILKQARTILSQLEQLQTDLQTVTTTLKNCTSIELLCLLNFWNHAKEIVAKIPAVVKEDMNEIIELIKTISNDMLSCNIKTVVHKNVQDIFNEAVTCIKS